MPGDIYPNYNNIKENALITQKILNISIRSFYQKINNKIGTFKNRRFSHPKVFNWNWEKKGFNRIAVVNCLVAKTGGVMSKYLEIGCFSNALFDSVACINKTGVDPFRGGTHRMTSDEFFITNREKYDVIFIDGLHEYEQIRKDAMNSLNVLNPGGWVAFHDLLPAGWREQLIPPVSNSWIETNAWNGDGWKLALELIDAKGIEFKILDVDHGVGIMRILSDDWYIPSYPKKIKSADYSTFVNIVDQLPIISFKDIFTDNDYQQTK